MRCARLGVVSLFHLLCAVVRVLDLLSEVSGERTGGVQGLQTAHVAECTRCETMQQYQCLVLLEQALTTQGVQGWLLHACRVCCVLLVACVLQRQSRLWRCSCTFVRRLAR
jgi:hypothetical protein